MAIYDTRAPGADRPLDHVEFGPGTDSDLDSRILGDVAGRPVLVLGCGAGHDAVGLTRRGARVTAVDRDADQIVFGRELAAREEVTVAFHQAALADLAFIQADLIDVAISVNALMFVEDLDRVFRQVHRVLSHGGVFVVSVPHPAVLCADPVDAQRTIRRWDDPSPLGDRWVHRAEDLVTTLRRANFEIDVLLERHSRAPGVLPSTIVVRSHKQGI